MKITDNKYKIIKFINREKNLGFVPTMGAIHKGHVSLIKKSISQCKKTIVTILCDHGKRYASKIFNKEFLKNKKLPIPKTL